MLSRQIIHTNLTILTARIPAASRNPKPRRRTAKDMMVRWMLVSVSAAGGIGVPAPRAAILYTDQQTFIWSLHTLDADESDLR